MIPDHSSSPACPPATRGEPALDGEVMPPLRRPGGEARQAPAAAQNKAARHVPIGLAVVAGLAIAAASGGAALEGYRWHLQAVHAAAAPGANAAVLAKLGKDVGDLRSAMAVDRQDDSLKALRKTVEQLRGEVDGLRSANAAATTQLAAKLESKSSATQPAMNEVVSRLDRIDHDPRLGEIASRLDRIEHQVASPAPTGTIAPAKPAAQAGTVQASVASAARPAKPVVLDNWIVRDVYSGIALVEGRSGSVREVVPGEVLPGAGEVQAIQRRGRGWIVVTSRGIIDTETW